MAEQGDFFEKLEALDEQITELTPIAVGRGMEHIHTVATPLVPVRDGYLVGSGGVTVHGDEARLTYEGPYARRQLYELDWHHTHGQALYLEQPMRTEADQALDIVAETLEGAF